MTAERVSNMTQDDGNPFHDHFLLYSLPLFRVSAAMVVFLLVGLLSGSTIGSVFAMGPPSITVDGVELVTSVPARIVDGKAMIPLQDLAPLTGGMVYFDPETGICRYVSAETRFVLVADRPEVRGNELLQGYEIPPPIADGDYLLVWVRFLADAFGWTIEWHADTNTVALGSVGVSGYVIEQHNEETSQRTRLYHPCSVEMDMLLRLISAEAHGEPVDGKVAVAAVVLNRIRSMRFPNSMLEVIRQPGQFSPVVNGEIDYPILQRAYDAAERALMGEDPSEDALFFYNPRIASATGRSFMETLEPTTVIGQHHFLRYPE